MSKLIPICIEGHLFGYYNPESKEFSCTHGAWSCRATLVGSAKILLHMNHTQEPKPFEALDKIPEEFIR